MKRRNSLPFVIIGFFHCLSVMVISFLPDFSVLPTTEEVLLWLAFLIGTISFIIFIFYKVGSLKAIIFRVVLLLLCNILCVYLFVILGLQQALSTVIPLKNIEENYAGMFIVSLFFGVEFYVAVCGIAIYSTIKLCKKWLKRKA